MAENTAQPKRVLVVDDDLSIRETTKDLLEFEGYEVLTATGGHAAIALLGTERIDVVVTDAVMPNGDGYELLAHIRATPDLRELPVIMVSARAEKKDLERGLESGADRYLSKPYSFADLAKALEAGTKLRSAGPAAGVPADDHVG